MREAYSHEVSSAGFSPGGNGTDYAAFYSYAYPQAAGFRDSTVQPAAPTGIVRYSHVHPDVRGYPSRPYASSIDLRAQSAYT